VHPVRLKSNGGAREARTGRIILIRSTESARTGSARRVLSIWKEAILELFGENIMENYEIDEKFLELASPNESDDEARDEEEVRPSAEQGICPADVRNQSATQGGGSSTDRFVDPGILCSFSLEPLHGSMFKW
jgi:hypothetical protein